MWPTACLNTVPAQAGPWRPALCARMHVGAYCSRPSCWLACPEVNLTPPPCCHPSLQFLTNVFLPIYLAQRLRPDPPPAGGVGSESGPPAADAAEEAVAPARLPSYAPAFGAVAMAVGAVSVGWALAARPEAGDLAARWAYFTNLLSASRVDWAFVVDAGLYYVWQAWLLGAAGAAPIYRFVPFWGMAAWLLAGPEGGPAEEGKAAAR